MEQQGQDFLIGEKKTGEMYSSSCECFVRLIPGFPELHMGLNVNAPTALRHHREVSPRLEMTSPVAIGKLIGQGTNWTRSRSTANCRLHNCNSI
jgi:hypothetical protein